MTKHILILAGDGVGPEGCTQVEKIIDWLTLSGIYPMSVTHDLIGGACYDVHGVALTDDTVAYAKTVDAILLGAVGGAKWDTVARAQRPEAGLLKIRKELDLFANIRPAVVLDALVHASTLKPEIISGLDIVIVRELTAGVYFGTPRGVEVLPNGTSRCIDTHSYTQAEIVRNAKVAFDMAKKRGGVVHSVDKANVMETGAFWRQVVSEYHAQNYPEVALHHMYADNCAMQLVRNPKQFDVILTDNLFGDMLSDVAAMCTGSLGMLPSASLGTGSPALYEPVHGSAPDIQGKNIANPSATILSFAMMLRYAFHQDALAAAVESAVGAVLINGIRTADIMADGCTQVTTDTMGDAILSAVQDILQQ